MLDKCLLISKNIPKLIENVITHNPETHFPLRNLDLTRTALLTRLNPYRDNEVLRKIFYVRKSSIDMKKIENKNLVINLHSLDMKVAYKQELRLIYNILAIAYLREALNKKEGDFVKNVFVADEAQMLVPKILQKAVVTDTWATTDFATRLRKRGESLVIISQSPANIEDDIRKNSQNLFVFRLQDPWDIKAIAGMLGYVHVDEVNYLSSMLTSLKARTAIVKTPLITYPFTIKTLEVNFKSIPEKELEKHFHEVEEIADVDLDEDDKDLLENIKKNPFFSNTKRALSLGWHRSKYSKIRKSLLRKGIVEEVSFKTKLRGAPSHFLKLKSKKEYGRGHFIHAFWTNKILDYLREQGYNPKTEYKVNDKIVDIAYRRDERLIFVEVEYKSNWKRNILQASRMCDKLISVFVKAKDIVEAMEIVKEQQLSNVIITDAYYCYKVLP
jgi:DNA-binding Lrp family transcriptional regulator